MRKRPGYKECCGIISTPKLRIRELAGLLVPTKIVQPGDFVKHSFPDCQQRVEDLQKNHLQTMRPALLFFSSSFRRPSIFSSNFLPVKSNGNTLTFSFGRAGRLSPQIRSTRLVLTPTSPLPPFFLIFSSNFRASAAFKLDC